ncbi:glycosyltransferase family 2 protein [Longitalea luteola]|uniref:glycosyltransferase family 2 protein n=1 Tax=Longitalea luteola TaxID=2812563 RepID=UPI001A95D9F1|nr:glycosyltransferase [Longitalea luteola]
MIDFEKTLIDRPSYFWTPDYVDVSAWIEHIPFAFWIIDVLKPKMVVELGVHTGTSYFAFCQAIKRLNINSTCYGVDMWTGDEHAGFYSDEVYNKVAAYNNTKYSRFSTLIRSTFDGAKDYFIDGSIDLLHIDGFHTYEAVKRDFETWLPKLSENAIVLFHDINVRERGFGVFRFWDELKLRYPHFQFDFGYGLGIICIGKPQARELSILFDHNTSDAHYLFLRNFFFDRGTFIKNEFYTSLTLKKEREQHATLQKNFSSLETEYNALKESHANLEENFKHIQVDFNNIDEKYRKELVELSEKLNAADNSCSSYTVELSVIKNKIEELNNQIQHQQQIIAWYKRTYEDRSILGVLKEKLKQKKNFLSDAMPATTYIDPFGTPLAKHSYFLQHVNGLTYDALRKQYTCEGADPYFIIDLKDRKLNRGWYWLSANIHEIKGQLFGSKLYFDRGRGFNESDIWNLPVISNGKIESLVYLPGKIYSLRFDPSITECTFQIDRFTLQPVNKLNAFFIAIEAYRKKYYPDEKLISFWMRSISAFLKTGKFTLKQNVSDFIYNKGTTSEKTSYKKWYELYDTITERDLEIIRSLSQKLTYQPLFSVIMPVYNAPVKYLKKAIESVRSQAYKNWELCIADDRSTNKAVINILKEYQKLDSRIKVVFRETNGHISLASNSALELASGDYIALLDQDDELRPHSLYMVAKAINENPDAQLFYSDEDKIAEDEVRFDPYFKTDWNADLFYGQNMINHLGVYKHSLVKKVGGFRQGYEGSQDHDLALRCIEQIKPGQIHHIPYILYHWRAIKGSTSHSMSSKNYAIDAGIKALRDHFKRTNQQVTVEQNVHNSYRVKWPVPDPHPLVSIVIPTKDKIEVLSTCVESVLHKTNYDNYEILIVDNNSVNAETFAYYQSIQSKFKQVKILSYQSEFNFSAIVNYGVDQSQGEIIVLLNNDTEVINQDWLYEMVSHCLRKGIGAVGAKLYYPNGLIQHAGVFLYEGHPGNHIYLKREKNDPGYFNKLNLVQNYSAVTGACLAVRKQIYLQAGGFDEKNLKVAYNDVDFCLKVRDLGYTNLWTPFAQLYHYESLSRGNDLNEKNIARFKKEHSFMLTKWKHAMNDPFFNHNLAIETHVTQLASPPRIRYEWQNI